MKKSQPTASPATIDSQRRQLVLAASGLSAGALFPGVSESAERPDTGTPREQGAAMFAYVGSRTTKERNARGEGISVYRVASGQGQLELVQVVGNLVNPSYLALSADGQRLYTVHGDASEVSAFAVNRANGQLTFLNRQSTQGRNPVHLAIDPTGKSLVVTNHIGSSLAILPLAADGSLLPVSQLITLSGPVGPHRIEQTQAKPHFSPFDRSGRHIIVPDKGLDRVYSFNFDAGQLSPAPTPYVQAREGAGPRHLAQHPGKPIVYVVNELDSTVTTYRFTPDTARLEPLQILSTLPPTFTGNSRAAGISIDHSGRYLYASNRGHDSIAVFRNDPVTGLPTFTGADLTLGRTPRFFTLSSDERLLYALNEDSDSIVAFAVDPHTGRLHATGQATQTGSPVCMVFSA